jgi:hypothetical protein
LTSAVLVACGSDDTEPTATQPVVTTIATTTTTATTVAPEPTITVDFDRDPDQGSDPIPSNATTADIIEVVDDVRGPTAGLSRQIGRLVPFAEFSSPAGAQIMDLTATAELTDDDDTETSVVVQLRAPQSGPELIRFFDDELRAQGWITAFQEDTEIDGVPWHRQTFRIPGVPGDTTELVVSVGAGPVTLVEIDYHDVDGDDDPLSELAAWQESVRIPSRADLVSASVTTADNVATLTVVHLMDADSVGDGYEDVIDLVRDNEFTISGGQATLSGPAVLTDPDGESFSVSVEESRDAEVVRVVVVTDGALSPID